MSPISKATAQMSRSKSTLLADACTRHVLQPWLAVGCRIHSTSGFLPGSSSPSRGFAISADGAVVVGNGRPPSGTVTDSEAFIWNETQGMVGLGDLPGSIFLSTASGTSADGLVVVGTSYAAGVNGGGPRAFRWTQQRGSCLDLGTLPGTPPGGSLSSFAHAVSADGSIVVGSHDNTCIGCTEEAIRWTQAGGMVGMGYLPGDDTSSAEDVSSDGSVVVGNSSHPRLRP